MILLQTSIVWTDQGLTSMFNTLIQGGLMLVGASFGYTFAVMAMHLRFRDEIHKEKIHFLEEWIPYRESLRESRRIAVVNALEPFVEHNPPVFTPHERELLRKAHDDLFGITDPKEVLDLIRAWDRYKHDPDLALQTAARETVRELNGYLAWLQASRGHVGGDSHPKRWWWPW
jgi:hypothetical protein